MLYGPGTYIPTRQKKEKAIQAYLDVVGVIAPVDTSLQRSCLWHTDLHVENVFVDPKDTTKITSIIDWQSTEAAPLFVQARPPNFIWFDGPKLDGLERPVRPSNMSDLSQEKRLVAESLFVAQSLLTLYRMLAHQRMPEVWKCFELQDSLSFNLFTVPRRLLLQGEAHYLSLVTHLAETDSRIKHALENPRTEHREGGPRLSLSPEGVAEIETAQKQATKAMDLMEHVLKSMGGHVSESGFVRPEQYEEAKAQLQEIKETILQKFAKTEEERAVWEAHWPFDG